MEKTKKPKETTRNQRKCTICKKAIVAIGNKRTNGKDHKDWETRETHKKCWIEDQQIKLFRIHWNL